MENNTIRLTFLRAPLALTNPINVFFLIFSLLSLPKIALNIFVYLFVIFVLIIFFLRFFPAGPAVVGRPPSASPSSSPSPATLRELYAMAASQQHQQHSRLLELSNRYRGYPEIAHHVFNQQGAVTKLLGKKNTKLLYIINHNNSATIMIKYTVKSRALSYCV